MKMRAPEPFPGALLPIRSALRSTSPQIKHLVLSQRLQSTSFPPSTEPATASLSPRWLSDIKQRIGKCMTFGLSGAQISSAGAILAEIARDWRELQCGSEGFLTSETRRGLFRHRVVWGEMDAMVGTHAHEKWLMWKGGSGDGLERAG